MKHKLPVHVILILVLFHGFALAKFNHFSNHRPLCPLTLVTNPVSVSCNGGSNGSATVTVNGGSGNYSYNWSVAGQTLSSISNLTAGTYSVTVTDNTGGCTQSASVIITQPASPLSITSTPTNVSCKGGNNGSVSISPAGGTAGYTYGWSVAGQTASSLNGLSAGTYSVTVTDSKGCTVSSSINITEPAVVSVTTAVVNVSCKNMATGSGTAAGVGGTPGYAYQWSNSATSATAANLTAGSYTVTVTDSKGCTLSSSINITEPAVVSVTTAVVNVSCKNMATGSGTAGGVGGTPGYSYQWSNSATSATAANLTAGSYTVTVTDSKGCTASSVVTVTEPATVLSVTTSAINVTCKNLANGSGTGTGAGGTSGYTYKWSNTATGATAGSLAPGPYTVTVTDSKGCTASSTVTITEPAAVLSSTTSVVNVSCKGFGNGSATVNVAGGTSAYNYNWSNSSTASSAANLTPGSYTVTVTDFKGCTTTNSVNITEPTALVPGVSSVNVTCYNYGNGSGSSIPTGGTPGYTYKWSNAGTSSSAANLVPGSYSVTVTDANGCTVSSNFNITEPPAPIKNTGAINVACNVSGAKDGKAWVTPNGTKVPYVYSWNPSLSLNDTIFNLSAGTYSLTVTDGVGCKQSTIITITQPPVLTGTSSGANSSCNGKHDGAATIVATGGTPAYNYSWNTTPSQFTATATGLGAGTYLVKLSDAHGCEFYSNVTISEAAPVFISTSSITKETCQQGNGKISISVIGGSTPYDYSWSPPAGGQTTSSISNLTAGTYSVTVTDSKGCSSTSTVAVGSQFSPPTAFASTVNNVSCSGAGNGSVTVLASSGTPPYVYNWSPLGGAGITANNLPPGTYSVTVTDANGCTVTSSAKITEPLPITLNPSSKDSDCGLTNGTISIAPTGGTLPYVITWSDGSIGNSDNNLSSGSYSVTLTDAAGCTATQNIILNPASGITVNISPVNVSCNGNADGKATIAASGGGGTFSYTWAPSGGNSSTASGLAVGTYSITVRDAGNTACYFIKTVTITEPPVLTTLVTPIGISCSGNNGQASASPSGGTVPYVYNWSNGSNSASLTGLSAGGYTVTVTDANGCKASSNGTVNPGSPVTASATGTNIKCFGQNTGQAVVSAGGGTGLYTYKWAPSGGNGATASNLAAGSYTVTVDDGSVSCTATSVVSITQPTVVIVNPTKVNANCNLSNGSAGANPAGGVPPYAYSWSDGGSSQSESNLAPGTYTVVVTDANGCTKSATISIVNAAILNLTVTKTNVKCNGAANGTASVNTTGGTGTYNYNWSPGGNATASASGLAPGVYTITVTDAGNPGCPQTTTVTITEPLVLKANVTGVNITCNGGNNGKASSAPSGGTGPYTYHWDNGSNSASITGLSANTYNVTVTDKNSCTAISSIVIVQGSALNVSINSQTNVSCFGLSNAAATVSASGGTGALAYNWSPSGGASATASGLVAGTYTVKVNDASNCSSTITVNITEPADIVTNSTSADASCGGANGTASLAPTGGTGPFAYLWSNGGVTSSATGLAVGSYTVTVTDASGCTKSETIIINVGNPISILTNKSDLTCNGVNNGSASANASGGSGNFNYSWSSGSTSTNISGLGVGTYTVVVTDAGNSACTSSAVVVINQPNPFVATATSTNIVCHGQTNGTASATANGGTPGYTYNWSAGAGNSISNLGAGDYTVTVTDAGGCTATSTSTVLEPPPLTLKLNNKNVTCQGTFDGAIGSTVTGGVPAYTYQWAPMGGSDSATGLGPGIYTLTVTDSYGCTITNTITLTEPPPFYINTSKKGIPCYLKNGEGYVNATGGSGSFSYSWSTGSNNDTITGLAPGTYQVRVVDLATGCDTIGSVTLAYPVVSLKMDSLNVTCNKFNNAKVWVNASGAAAPYAYSWSSGASTNDSLTGLAPGSYTVTVHDSGGCVTIASKSVTEPPALALTKTSTDVACFGGNNGTAGITASGGIKSYTYSWSSGQATNNVNALSAGTYKIALLDSNSCVLVDSVIIKQPLKLVVIGDSVNTSCIGATDGQVIATASGGTGTTYSYSWSTGATGNTATGLAPGVYTVSVTDANACVSTDDVNVVDPTPLVLVMSKGDPNCGQKNGKASVSASGSNGNYTYQWAPVAGTKDTLSNLSVGSYTVTVSDSKGCSKVDFITLVLPPPVTITKSSTNLKCYASNDGTATINATGGSGNFIYKWSPTGDSISTLANLSAGAYKVTVLDKGNPACPVVDSVRITQPAILKDSVSSTNITCFGMANGTASAVVSGGTTAYTYSWSNGSSVSGLNNLGANAYTVLVTDANGCTTSDTAKISEPALLAAVADSVNIICNGYNNGQVSVVAGGGTTPYKYLWSPGASTKNIVKNLAPGTYIVTVTDANGCTASDAVNVTQPPGMILTMNHTNTACSSSFGTAGVTVSNGAPAYTYLWSNGGTISNISSLAKGLYKVTITDATGCTKSDSVKITEPNGVNVTLAATNVTCNGANNGKITATATGGTGSYSYSWIPGGNSNTTLTGLAPGIYVIKVIDVANPVCYSKDSVTITEPAVLTGSLSKTDVACFGAGNGSLIVADSGGTVPYTYAWSGSVINNDSISGLTAGGYTVTVTDSKGCKITTNITITQPAVIITSTSIKQGSCGIKDGEAYVSASGGIGPYGYSWTPVYSSNDSLFNLLPGKYFVYVIDAIGCIKKDSATVTLTNGIITKLTAKKVSCFGQSDGEATVVANGGSGNFIYDWNPGNNTNQNIYSLSSGMYTVTVSDINITGCSKVDSIFVPQPQVLGVNISISKPACNSANDYVATATGTGGTPGYSFSWSFGGNGAVQSNLAPGTYIINVRDTNGCDTARIFTINTLSIPIILPPLKVNPKCNLANGTIDVSIFGGTTPYKYSWSPLPDTTSSVKNIAAGVYTLTVTDAYSCTDVRTVALINTALPPNVFTKVNPAFCFGSATGSVKAIANAGSVPYSYSWSPSGGTLDSASALTAGSYTITVTDAQACTAAAVAVVTEPPPITIVLTPDNVSCFGGSDGFATALVGGGTPAYSYSWSSGGTSLTETNLKAGDYYFTVTDSNSCVKADTVKITEPPKLAITMSKIKHVSCYGGNTGMAHATVTGGTKNYTYSWSPAGGTDSIATPLISGSYTLNVNDSLGCKISDTVFVKQPGPFAVTSVKKNISCFGKNDGQARVKVSGASSPYVYVWFPVSSNTDTVSGLHPGSFTVQVIDSLGCVYTHIDSVTQPTQLLLAANSLSAHCYLKDGSVTTVVSGATLPYSYSWSGGSGGTGSLIDSLVPGSYTVTVTDNNGCTLSTSANVGKINGPQVTVSKFSNTTCSGRCVGAAESQVTGGTGSYTYSWNTTPPQLTANAQNICEGDYNIVVTDSAGCTDTAKVHIASPSIGIKINAPDTNICIGQTTQLGVNATGGTPAYTFTWNNGVAIAPSYAVSPLVTTTYTVVGNDANNCPSQPVTITVKVKPPLRIKASSNPAGSCPGVPVTVSVVVSGGDSNYVYTWQPGGYTGTTINIMPDSSITYIVRGSDGCGTPPDSVRITIPVFPNPVVDFVSTDTASCVNTCTSFVDKSSAATGYTITNWMWKFGDGASSTMQNPVHCYGKTGQYAVSLSIRTNSGCDGSLTKNNYVNVYGLPIAGFRMSSDSVSVNNPIIYFTDESFDAVKWEWDFGDESVHDSVNLTKNPKHIYSDTGRYCVRQIVENVFGCKDTVTHCLRVYPEWTFYIPNAFSPNDDGINDLFNGKGRFIKQYKMIIFDRWGNLIYTTDSLIGGWDGRANGGVDVAQQDVYVWKVELFDVFDVRHQFIGHVTLVK